MTTVYVLLQRGVYRHGCFGVFTDSEVAKQKAEEAVEAQRDGYHEIEVVPVPLDTLAVMDSGKAYPEEAEPIHVAKRPFSWSR